MFILKKQIFIIDNNKVNPVPNDKHHSEYFTVALLLGKREQVAH